MAGAGAIADAAAVAERLPFFVYGTLMTGYGNHANVVRGRFTRATAAALAGARIYHFDVGFPGMYRGAADESVVGQLLDVPLAVYDDVLRELDALESYYAPRHPGNMYERIAIEVAVGAGAPMVLGPAAGAADTSAGRGESSACIVRAWAYECLLELSTISAAAVPDGNWRRFMAEGKLVDAADDWATTIASSRTVDVASAPAPA